MINTNLERRATHGGFQFSISKATARRIEGMWGCQMIRHRTDDYCVCSRMRLLWFADGKADTIHKFISHTEIRPSRNFLVPQTSSPLRLPLLVFYRRIAQPIASSIMHRSIVSHTVGRNSIPHRYNPTIHKQSKCQDVKRHKACPFYPPVLHMYSDVDVRSWPVGS